MADPYRSFAPLPHDRDLRSTFPGYLPSDGPSLAPNAVSRVGDLRGRPDLLRNDVLPLRSGTYGLDGPAAGRPAASGLGGLAAGARARGFTPLEDPALVRRDTTVDINHGIPDVERPNSLLKPDLSAEDSNILYVDGLPTDCTRREVAHLFRPFIGFKDIRVVHKEPRRSGDKGYVLCFVEFTDAKCALTAMEALQEYRFDDRKPDAPVLRIQFVRFPFRPPAARDDQRRASVH